MIFIMLTKNEIKVRKMRESDIPLIIQISRENNLSEWSADSYKKEINGKDSISLCVLSKKLTIGFIVVRLIMIQANINNNSNTSVEELYNINTENEAEILNIGIRKSMQYRGFGQYLFDKTLREIEKYNIKTIWLELRKSNQKALQFYLKNDFTIQFERKNYYTNPTENAIVMKKTI